MGTRYRGQRRDVAALNAYITLMRAAESVTKHLQPPLEKAGLTISQFGVLEALLHLGPLHQCDLSQKLLKTRGNLTLVLDNLEVRGLVRRVRSGEDRRFFQVRLTDAGRRLIQGIFPRHVERIAGTFAALTLREQEALRRLCRTLGRGACRMSDEGGGCDDEATD